MADGVDHCTGWFEGWWAACCARHDADYLAQLGRLLADDRLLDCVSASLPAFAAGHPVLAAAIGAASAAIGVVMFGAVRLLGGRFYRRAGLTKKAPPGS